MQVAPDDVVRGALLTRLGQWGYVWDVGPLFELLTPTDMDEMLSGCRHAVQFWWLRQLHRPVAERPAGLPTDLTARGFAGLAVNTPLLAQALDESAPLWLNYILEWFHRQGLAAGTPNQVQPFDAVVAVHQAIWSLPDRGAAYFQARLQLDADAAGRLALQRRGMGRRHLQDPSTRAEYDRRRTSQPDTWRLRRYAAESAEFWVW